MKGSSFGFLMCLQKKGNPFAFICFRFATKTTSISVRNSREPEVKSERFNIDYPYSFTAFRKIGHVRAGCMFFSCTQFMIDFIIFQNYIYINHVIRLAKL